MTDFIAAAFRLVRRHDTYNYYVAEASSVLLDRLQTDAKRPPSQLIHGKRLADRHTHKAARPSVLPTYRANGAHFWQTTDSGAYRKHC